MKFKSGIIFIFVYLFASLPLMAADEAVFARYPAPSPDGLKIAFSYHGDIWVVPSAGGRALRLTVHEAYDYAPVWSPDGTLIAFSSDRFGNDDVYVIPSEGGEARRLTFLSIEDTVTGWTPDGQNILFTSNRDYCGNGFTRVPYVYSVALAGGEPVQFMPEPGNEAVLSPDGEWLAYTDHSRGGWWRKHYRGSSDNDIWIWNLQSGEFRQITDHPGNDAHPMWSADGSALYYLSDEDNTFNIWKADIATGTKTQITSHDDHVRFPTISRDGSLIAYELGTDLFTIGTGGGEPQKLSAIAPSDTKFNTTERLTMSRGADEMAVSPDNEDIAFVVRGELFAMKEKGGNSARLTESAARDHQITWNTEGTALVFSSDREGSFDLFQVESDDPEEKRLSKALAFKITRITNGPGQEMLPLFSPDGKLLAYQVDKGDLHILNMETKEDTVLLEGWDLDGFSWSPDSKWIAYSRNDREFNADIWVIPAAGGEAVNVSKHPDNEFNPVWSPDGRKLAFISRRLDNNFDVWFVFLRKSDDEKTAEDWEEEEEQSKAKKPERSKPAAENDKKEDAAKEEKPELEVKIDFEDINLRLRQVISLPGSERGFAISPDGKTFAFVSNNGGTSELYTVKWDGTELKQVTRGDSRPRNLNWSKDGKKIYFLRAGGTIQSVSPNGGGTETHGFRARTSIDYPAERSQKYEDAWRALDLLFYDPNFHGADWGAVREKYRSWAMAAVETRDFNDVVNMVYGELNASHLGIRGGFDGSGGGDRTGMLGLTFDPAYRGPGLKVTEVIKNGPADKEISKVEPGQFILSINGTPVSMETNIEELLVDTVDQKVVVVVADQPDAEETQRLIIRPVSTRDNNQLLYERFVDNRREMTHQLSDGRIGYLHVQGMNRPSLERFEMELYSEAYDKDAIVIDVRNNGGGSTTDLMLAMLQVKDHARTQARGSSEWGYPQDRRVFYAWTKPIIVLCNEYSFSNAEIFSWSIKTLGRGKVVGQQTYGAVISTGAYPLIDGSYVRTPGRGWYVYGTDINMENNGCPPDIVVVYQPGEDARGIDSQLKRAVQELLSEINE